MNDIFNSFKLLNHFNKIENMIKNNNTYPIAVEIDLTNLCNHDCIWCMFDRFKAKNPVSLSEDLVYGLLQELKDCGIKAITYVGGGEPTLHKAFDKIIEKSFNMGFDVGVVTNGELLEDKAEIIQKYCKFVRVSLDAGTKRTHDALHKPKSNNCKKTSGVTAFGKIIKGIRKVCKNKGDLIVGTAFLVHPDNYFELPELVDLLSVIGVDYIQIRPVFMKGLIFSDKLLSDLDKIIQKCDENVKGTGLHIVTLRNRFKEFNGDDLLPDKCLAHNLLTIIGADGKVYLCCQLRGNSKFELGDLNKQYFREIWNSEQRQEAIKKIDLSRCPPCRYKTYNKIMGYMASERRHSNFL